jgi:hypothetical protein
MPHFFVFFAFLAPNPFPLDRAKVDTIASGGVSGFSL